MNTEYKYPLLPQYEDPVVKLFVNKLTTILDSGTSMTIINFSKAMFYLAFSNATFVRRGEINGTGKVDGLGCDIYRVPDFRFGEVAIGTIEVCVPDEVIDFPYHIIFALRELLKRYVCEFRPNPRMLILRDAEEN